MKILMNNYNIFIFNIKILYVKNTENILYIIYKQNTFVNKNKNYCCINKNIYRVIFEFFCHLLDFK